MFGNIGEKIKGLAIFCTIIGCVLSIACAIFCCATDMILLGFVILVAGGLLSWVGSFLLYGFGELITQTTNIAQRTLRMQMLSVNQNAEGDIDTSKKIIEEMQNEAMEDYENEQNEYIDELEKINRAEKDECPNCFNKIRPNDKECSYCGYKLK